MIKFLLCLPLAIFVIVQVFVVYQLGSIVASATHDNVTGLIGEWSFFQIILAVVLMMAGIILAAFLYIIVVIKPVFYPPPPDEPKPRKRIRRSSYVAPANPEQRGRKTLIIALIIIGLVFLGLAATGIVFRENIAGFVTSVIRSAGVDDYFAHLDRAAGDDGSEVPELPELLDDPGGEDYIPAGDEPYAEEPPPEPEPLPEPEPEPEVLAIERRPHNEIDVGWAGWTVYFPAALEIVDIHPVGTWPAVRTPMDEGTQMLYWSEPNTAGYADARAFLEADAGGIFAAADDFQLIDDNSVVALFTGETYFSIRFWYVYEGRVGMIDISVVTQEEAGRWFDLLGRGAVYVVRTPPPAEQYEAEQ